MRIFLDQNLSSRVAAALREVDLDCRAVGDDGCPPRGMRDREIVAWCARERRLLVTSDLSGADPEMREAVDQHKLPVVMLRRQPKPVPLLHGLLNAWDGIGEAWGRAARQERHLKLNLDPVNGNVSRVRRGARGRRTSWSAASIGPRDRPL